MYEALTAMVCNQLLWGFAHILYLTTLRSNIPPCQKATTLILIPLDNPSFHLGKSSKTLWALLYFCLGRLLKSVTVTSFSQLHLSRNYGSSWSLDQINLHFLALHTRWLIKKAKTYEKLSWRCVSFLCRLLLWRFAKISKYGFCTAQNIH